MVKKGLLFSILMIMTVVVAACGEQNEAADGKVLQVGATGQSYPYAYKEKGELTGFDVELIETIADNLGYEVEWHLMDFSGVMAQMETGRLDTVANQIYITDER